MKFNWNRTGESIRPQPQIYQFRQGVDSGGDAASELIVIEVKNEELGASPNVWDYASQEILIKAKSAKFRELTEQRRNCPCQLVGTKEHVTNRPELSQL
jgi:hypothetical protein